MGHHLNKGGWIVKANLGNHMRCEKLLKDLPNRRLLRDPGLPSQVQGTPFPHHYPFVQAPIIALIILFSNNFLQNYLPSYVLKAHQTQQPGIIRVFLIPSF